MGMQRKEFEQILKRSLELKSQQKKQQEDNFAIEDLQSAAARLGIEPEILEQVKKLVKHLFKNAGLGRRAVRRG